MTLEETIKNMEQVIDFSCDEDAAKHKQKIAYLKELQDIEKNSIVIPKTSTAWEAAQLIINTKCEYKLAYSNNKKLLNVFEKEEIMALGKHLLSYAEIENELNE